MAAYNTCHFNSYHDYKTANMYKSTAAEVTTAKTGLVTGDTAANGGGNVKRSPAG
jgi:hypothetical protein